LYVLVYTSPSPSQLSEER
jgi:hypothetical protein